MTTPSGQAPVPVVTAPDPWAPVKSYIEVGTKTAAILGAAAYGFGLVVLHTHLQRYGVNTLGFFAPQYVAAGVWVLLFAGFFVSMGYLLRKLLRNAIGDLLAALGRPDRPKEPRWWRRKRGLYDALLGLWIYPGIVVFGIILVSLVVLPILGVHPGLQWLEIGLLPFGLGLLFTGTWTAFRKDLWVPGAAPPTRPENLPGGTPWSLYLFSDAGIAWLICTPFTLLLFANRIYPTVPARWGGGGPVQVQVVIAAANAGQLQRGMAIKDSLAPSIVGQLLLLTDQDLLVVPDGHTTALLLPRTGVVALVLEPLGQVGTEPGTTRWR